MLKCSKILFFLIISYFSNSILSQTISISNTNIYSSASKGFLVDKDIIIKSGKILEIKDSKKKNKENYYILPGFCDTSVNLLFNSIGTYSSYSDLKLAMRSYLAHGVTNLITMNSELSINEKLIKLKREKSNIPTIQFSNKILVIKSEEYPLLPKELYYQGETHKDLEEEFNRQLDSISDIIRLYYRVHESNKYNFSSTTLNKWKQMAFKKGKKIEVTTFSDRLAIEESVKSGVFKIKDPIPMTVYSNIPISTIKKLEWTPHLELFYTLTLNNIQKREAYIQYLGNKSPFFNLFYREQATLNIERNLRDEDSYLTDLEFLDFTSPLQQFPEINQNIIAGSGAGHFFVFPGISLLEEYYKQASLTKDLIGSLESITSKSCIGFKDYDGTIREGNYANLVLYKINPLETIDNIFLMDRVYNQGVLQEIKRSEGLKKK
jgi:hypothetical protein